MKSVFNKTNYKEIRKRIESLMPNAQKQWGTMNVAQMMAHCSAGLDNALGKTPFVDKSNFIMRTLVKKIVLNAVKKGDLGKNQKTFPIFLITGERDFDSEKLRLLQNLDEYFAKGNEVEIGRHPYFGKFSKDNWGQLQYVHFNHHLTQFSA
jgi:hypothetical protein